MAGKYMIGAHDRDQYAVFVGFPNGAGACSTRVKNKSSRVMVRQIQLSQPALASQLRQVNIRN